MADENSEEEKGFKVTDRRFSSQSEEEKKESDAKKEKNKIVEAEDLNKDAAEFNVNFASFVMSLSTSALIQLGKINDPVSKQTAKNLDAAKQTIDILAVIQQKTKGNLTPQEQAVMDSSLYDLRLMYVEETKK